MFNQWIDQIAPKSHRKPAFHLTVRPNPKENPDSQNITEVISPRLISLTLTDNRGFEADQLDLVLDDADGKLQLPSRGAILSLALGWQGEGLVEKGEYTVDELEHSGAPDIVTIRARSADLRSTLMERKERSFHQKTIGEIVHQIASENQLTALVSQKFDKARVEHIDQAGESAINLLTRLAQERDAIATVKNGNLLFMEAGTGKTASGKALPVVQIHRQSGDSHRFAIAEGDNYKAVKAYWHDTNTGKRGEVYFDGNTQVERKHKPKKVYQTKSRKAKSKGRKAKEQNTPLLKPSGKKLNEYGLDLELDANSESEAPVRKARKTKKAKKKGGGLSKKTYIELNQTAPVETDSDNIKLLPHTYGSKQNARTAVIREFGRLQRGVASFSLALAFGNPELMPETPVQVQGFKAEIDSNEWIITQATHTLSADNGLTTSLEMELKVGEEKEKAA